MVSNSGGSRISKAGVANHTDGGAKLLFDNVFFFCKVHEDEIN